MRGVMNDNEALLEQVLSLPEPDRAEVAVRIRESLEPQRDEDVDEAWAVEIERRCAAVDAGTMVTSDWNDVRRRIERDIFGRG
jgi:putative addiction module component (TIGR02574 family)